MSAFFATIAIFAIPIYFVAVKGFRGSAFSANSVKVIIVFHFGPILFGVVAIGFFNFSIWQGLEAYLTDTTRFIVGLQSVFTIHLMLVLLYFFRRQFRRLDEPVMIRRIVNRRFSVKKLPVAITFSIILFYIFELVRIPVVPLVVAVTEGPIAGAIARGDVIHYQIANGIPGLGYILTFAPTIGLVWLYTQYLVKNVRILFWILALVYFGFNILFLSKSIFIVPVLMFMWIRYTDKHVQSDFKSIILMVSLVIFMFTFVEFGSANDLLVQILKRSFVSQTQGMFLIREFYQSSDLNALLYGLPGKYLFGFETFDPSVEIIRKLGMSTAGFVNMNSFFVGQGFVMLGHAIVLLGPISYALNIWVILVMGSIFKRCCASGLMRVIQFYFILTLSINTNFALLLFIRPIFGFILVSIFFEVLCILSNYHTREKSNMRLEA